jgi:hypothetical protein
VLVSRIGVAQLADWHSGGVGCLVCATLPIADVDGVAARPLTGQNGARIHQVALVWLAADYLVATALAQVSPGEAYMWSIGSWVAGTV